MLGISKHQYFVMIILQSLLLIRVTCNTNNGSPSTIISSRIGPKRKERSITMLDRRSDDDSHVQYMSSKNIKMIQQLRQNREQEEMMNGKDQFYDDQTGELYQQKSESLWPPWPFNQLHKPRSVMLRNGSSSNNNDDDDRQSRNRPGIKQIVSYLRLNAKGSFAQIQQLGSAFSYHLPPAAPPLLLLAVLPTRNLQASSSSSVTTILAIEKIAQKMALASLGIAVLSWADYENRKRRKLTPLPLAPQYENIRKAVLPPFLPEELPPMELDPVLISSSSSSPIVAPPVSVSTAENENDSSDKSSSNITASETDVSASSHDNYLQTLLKNSTDIDAIKNSIHKFYEKAPTPRYVNRVFQSWKKMNHLRKRQDLEMKRRKIMEELIFLKEIKMRHYKKQTSYYSSHKKARDFLMSIKSTTGNNNLNGDIQEIAKDAPLGWALVTGASRGIGRSIAIELARWEIPLILVARDINKLKSLADDIQNCYGVNCCVIQADLAKSETAKQIYDTTEEAGLRVDILVNNAGMCYNGDFIQSEQDELSDSINLNVASVTKLSHLYGNSMKKQRRGRILFVSSVAGSVPGGPGVAVYSATKAYEKVLAHSLGRELEKYGVGVSCLSPGAVKGTDFAHRSNLETAACFKIPFYAMKSPDVAERGVRALLSGDAEVIPGWHNRLFLKILSPILPQRVTSSIVEFSFSPVKVGIPSFLPWRTSISTKNNDQEELLESLLNEKKWPNKSPPLILDLPKLMKEPEITIIEDKEKEGEPEKSNNIEQDGISSATEEDMSKSNVVESEPSAVELENSN